jgi:hypothetical protein
VERFGGPRSAVNAIVLACALALLAACSGSSGAARPTATSTPTTASLTTPGAGSPTPGVTPIDGGGATQGNNGNICAAQPSGTQDLPASIPPYPNGDLRVRPGSDGSGFFGICTADSVATATAFYTAQLPPKGWGQLNATLLAGVELISATKGSATISVAIRPEPGGGKTDIVIQTSGL